MIKKINLSNYRSVWIFISNISLYNCTIVRNPYKSIYFSRRTPPKLFYASKFFELVTLHVNYNTSSRIPYSRSSFLSRTDSSLFFMYQEAATPCSLERTDARW